MQVIDGTVHQFVAVGIEILPIHSLEMSAWDDVPEMGDDAVRDPHLTLVVEIEAPRIRRSPGEGLEHPTGRMITPDAAIDWRHAVRRAFPERRRLEFDWMPLQP